MTPLSDAGPDRPPVARYVLRREHHVRALLRASADANRRIRNRYMIYAAVTLALWVVFHSSGPLFGTSALFLYSAVVFAVAAALRPVTVRRQAERLVAGRADLDHPVEVRVAGGAFVIEIEGVLRAEQRLGTLHAVLPEADGILVEPFPNEALWIPSDAFGSSADRTAFERALLAEARLPDPAL